MFASRYRERRYRGGQDFADGTTVKVNSYLVPCHFDASELDVNDSPSGPLVLFVSKGNATTGERCVESIIEIGILSRIGVRSSSASPSLSTRTENSPTTIRLTC